MKIPKKILDRQHEITSEYLKEIDIHLTDILEGRTETMFEIRDFATLLHIHPTHLTNTVKLVTGNHPCYYFENKILEIAKQKLSENKLSISAIASLLTYDPSNFTKWFKKFQGVTPTEFRNEMQKNSKTNTLSASKT